LKAQEKKHILTKVFITEEPKYDSPKKKDCKVDNKISFISRKIHRMWTTLTTLEEETQKLHKP